MRYLEREDEDDYIEGGCRARSLQMWFFCFFARLRRAGVNSLHSIGASSTVASRAAVFDTVDAHALAERCTTICTHHLEADLFTVFHREFVAATTHTSAKLKEDWDTAVFLLATGIHLNKLYILCEAIANRYVVERRVNHICIDKYPITVNQVS